MQRLILSLAFATMPVSSSQANDGQRLTDACLTCHGSVGQGSGAIPAIAGRSVEDMTAALTSARDNGATTSMMGRLMRGYTDAEITAIAAYLATLK